MIYVLKTKLPENKSVFVALLSVYGIGPSRSMLICRKLGFLPALKVKDISKEQTLDLENLKKSNQKNLKNVLNLEYLLLLECLQVQNFGL